MRRTSLFILLVGALAVTAPAFASASPAHGGGHGCMSPYCPSHRLKVNRGGDGTGTVTSSPSGIDCGATCEADYEEGTEVTLNATAAPGSTFDHWAGGGCPAAGACVLTIEHNTTVTAVFHRQKPHRSHPPHPRVHVRPTPHGAARCTITLPQPGKAKIWGPAVRAAYIKAGKKGKYKVVLRPKGRVRQHLRNRGWTRRKRIVVVYVQGSTRTRVTSVVRFHDRRHRG